MNSATPRGLAFKATTGETATVDAAGGRVVAIVSSTGITDSDNDRIAPGAYAETLEARTPKIIAHHQWSEPVARVLDAQEWMPGDRRLPPRLLDAGAGALVLEMLFSTATQRARETLADIAFFGPEQEWSIGYRPVPGSVWTDPASGTRHLEKIDLFEASPVLFGSGVGTETLALSSKARTFDPVAAFDRLEALYDRIILQKLDRQQARAEAIIANWEARQR